MVPSVFEQAGTSAADFVRDPRNDALHMMEIASLRNRVVSAERESWEARSRADMSQGGINLALHLLREFQEGRERALSNMARGSVEYNNVVRALVEARERISVLEAQVARVQSSADQLGDA